LYNSIIRFFKKYSIRNTHTRARPFGGVRRSARLPVANRTRSKWFLHNFDFTYFSLPFLYIEAIQADKRSPEILSRFMGRLSQFIFISHFGRMCQFEAYRLDILSTSAFFTHAF
jgi:hypothetical protein